jgi:hypothetical protein
MLLLMSSLLTMLCCPFLALLLHRFIVVSIQTMRLDTQHAHDECDPGTRGHKVVDVTDTVGCGGVSGVSGAGVGGARNLL